MIAGLKYIPDFIDTQQQSDLIELIDTLGVWSDYLKRRTQHYGYKYDYTKRALDDSMKAPPIPWWLKQYTTRLVDDGIVTETPDQLIINEYLPGRGIGKHVDCVPCFGDTIVSLSLGSICSMEFEHLKSDKRGSMLLAPGSLLVIFGEARYDWTHSIPSRLKDDDLVRSRRVSVTFRKVLSSGNTNI
jgi:alkylated DNA repair dioxygenase AlkB